MKKIVAIFLIFCMLFSFAACGEDNVTSDVSSTFSDITSNLTSGDESSSENSSLESESNQNNSTPNLVFEKFAESMKKFDGLAVLKCFEPKLYEKHKGEFAQEQTEDVSYKFEALKTNVKDTTAVFNVKITVTVGKQTPQEMEMEFDFVKIDNVWYISEKTFNKLFDMEAPNIPEDNESGSQDNNVTPNMPVKSDFVKLNYTPKSSVKNGVMVACDEYERYGLISTSGEVLVDFVYAAAFIEDGGYSVFGYEDVYDNKGNLVCVEKNGTIKHCANGVLLVSETGSFEYQGNTYNTKNTYKKFDGTVIYTFYGGVGGPFNSSGLAWLTRNDTPYSAEDFSEIINMNGQVVYSTNHGCTIIANENWLVSDNGIILTKLMVASYLGVNYVDIISEKSNYINYGNNYAEDDRVTFHPAYDSNENQCFEVNGLSVFEMNGTRFVYDINQKQIVKGYVGAEIGPSKYILVKNSQGKWGYIDKTGKEYKFYDDATSFRGGVAMVKEGNKMYIINENFQKISEELTGYDSASTLGDKVFVVRKNGVEHIIVYTK